MLALLIVAAQTFRHVYIRWVEPRDSVLDQFREKTEQEIAESKPLDELAAQYAGIKKKVQEEDTKHEEEVKRLPVSERDADYARLQREPYTSERLLHEAIELRERHQRELRELHFFWLCGLACVLLGFAAYFEMSAWFGTTLLLLGYLEMIWVTSPSFRSFGAAQEFDRLLTAKVIYSIVTLLLVLIAWLFVARSQATHSPSPAAR
jgi:hypothetical protein